MNDTNCSSISAVLAEAPLVLALDVGTSSVRAIVFDRLGRAVEGLAARRPHAVTVRRDGTQETDADSLLELLFECIDEVCERAAERMADVAGVAACTFVSNLLGVDAYGQACTPLMTYADTRPTADAAALRRTMDETAVHNRTGCLFHPSYLPARFTWMQRTRPEWLAAAARWMSLGEYWEQKLFGRARASYSVASWSGLLNRASLDWDGALLSALPLRREQLSALCDVDEALRGLRPTFARRWPALAQVPWYPAVGDGAAANTGDLCVGPGRIAVTIGTSSAVRTVLLLAGPAAPAGEKPEVPAGLWCYRIDRERELLGGALSEGGGVFAWLRRTLELEVVENLEHELALIAPDSHGLTFLPLLSGERSPGWRGDLRGALHGLSMATTPTEIARAALEGIAYRIGQVYQRLRPVLSAQPLVVLNGGAVLQSPAWIQIITDVLDTPLRVSLVKETSARGAGLLALRSLGALPDFESAPDCLGRVYEPDPARHAIYAGAMRRQDELYSQVSET